MRLFKSKKDEERRKSAGRRVPEDEVQKEVNPSSIFPDEKIVSTRSVEKQPVEEPESEYGTMSTLPSYQEGTISSASRTDSTRKSTTVKTLSSTSSDVGPDIHPVTQSMISSDDGKEVFIPGNNTPASLSVSNLRQLSRSYREYNFYYTNTMTHLIICDPDQQALYFAEVSPFAKNMPDVCLRNILDGGFDDMVRKGSGLGLKEAQAAPIVAVADSMPNSKHIKLALGDPLQPESQKWMLMKNVHEDLKAGCEKFDLVIGRPGQKDTSYQWIRGMASDKDTSDTKEMYRMLSEDGVVASFRNAAMTSIKKRGVLRVYDRSSSEDMLLLTFLGCAALCEKQRRRKVKKSFFLGL